jgi:hypothetical protein
MSSNQRGNGGSRRNRRLIARGVRRPQPDLPRLTRALIQLAMSEAAAEAAAQAEHEQQRPNGDEAADD